MGAELNDELIETRVRALAEALVQSGLERLRVAEGELEIELRRSAPSTVPPERSGRYGEQASAASSEGSEASYDVVTADVVGRIRFLRPPVVAGTALDSDRELAFVEALGIRNPIRSRGPGRVAVVYVEEGQAVDYGAPLFAIDRAGAR
ncbi:MAG: acetyl-CoA carboxylase biotin carboxyl carrier protein subunit [Candidatus Eremiobacteraeota bacterium]|nr:acetyl-CoA carboxylase biotin carboxyl carrier protein subunit [Candidatus Eremiobacteraeota bacterium]